MGEGLREVKSTTGGGDGDVGGYPREEQAGGVGWWCRLDWALVDGVLSGSGDLRIKSVKKLMQLISLLSVPIFRSTTSYFAMA